MPTLQGVLSDKYNSFSVFEMQKGVKIKIGFIHFFCKMDKLQRFIPSYIKIYLKTSRKFH